MKKSILSTVITFFCIVGLSAQVTEFDAMRIAQTDITGTARYMGMAGAFGALGEDVSAVRDNPAGLGVFRSSDLTTTFNFLTQRANSNWNGQTAQEDFFGFGFNNIGLVLASPTRNSAGLLFSNWGVSYSRLKNFNRNVAVRGNPMDNSITDYFASFTNGISASDFGFRNDFDVLPWMSILAYETFLINPDVNDDALWYSLLNFGETVTPRYRLEESGHIDQVTISWGGNINNTLFLGANVNFHSINYRMTSNYIENFGDGESLNLSNHFRTTGTGVSFDVGLIYRPVDFLRFGLAYKTPMTYNLTNTYSGSMRTSVMYFDERKNKIISTPTDRYDHEIRIPGRVTASAAGIIGRRAIISGDFIYTNYRNIRLQGINYYEDNEMIRRTFNHGMMVRLGAEYNLTNQWAVRAGFATETPTMQSTAMKQHHLNATRTDPAFFRHIRTNYFTAGLGYTSNSWYFDAAFVNRNLVQDFIPYETAYISPARVTTRNFDVVATVGLRF